MTRTYYKCLACGLLTRLEHGMDLDDCPRDHANWLEISEREYESGHMLE